MVSVLRQILFFACFLALGVGTCIGQVDATEDLYELVLDEYLDIQVASASRSQRSVKDLPITVHIITREEIEKNHYTSLVEILKDVPGLRVGQPGNGVDGELFMMRGLVGNSYTKILIDGQPMSPSVASGMPLGEQINMTSIERIEIIFGPAAALYGADALAGVINIITKDIANDKKQSFSTRLTGGELGYVNTSSTLSFNNPDKKIKFTVDGVFSKRDDLKIKKGYTDVFTDQDPTTFAKLPSRSAGLGFKLNYKNWVVQYNLLNRRDHSAMGQSNSDYDYNTSGSFWGETIQRYALRHNATKGKFNFSTNVSYLKYRLDTRSAFKFTFLPTNSYKFAASDDLMLEEIVIYNLSEDTELMGGAVFQAFSSMPKTNDLSEPFDRADYRPFRNLIPTPDPVLGDFGYNPRSETNLASFVQLTNTGRKHTLMASARIDHHSRYKTSFSPRISFLVNMTNKTAFRSSFGRAFRAPSGYYTYNSVAFPADTTLQKLTFLVVPNERLRPERLITFEMGVRQLIGRKWSFETIFLQNEIRDLIYVANTKLNKGEASYYQLADSDSTLASSNGGSSMYSSLEMVLTGRNLSEKLALTVNASLGIAKGMEFLPNGDTLSNFRQLPLYFGKMSLIMAPFKSMSIKFLKDFYLRIDNTTSSGWYVARIDSRAAYELPQNKVGGKSMASLAYSIFDVNARFGIAQNSHVYIKCTNVFNTRFAGVDPYNASVSLNYGPQMLRMFYVGGSFSF